MNWDPASYAHRRIDELTARVRTVEVKTGEHEHKIRSIESWQASLQSILRRWPYIAIIGALALANIAPTENLKLILSIIKAGAV